MSQAKAQVGPIFSHVFYDWILKTCFCRFAAKSEVFPIWGDFWIREMLKWSEHWIFSRKTLVIRTPHPPTTVVTHSTYWCDCCLNRLNRNCPESESTVCNDALVPLPTSTPSLPSPPQTSKPDLRCADGIRNGQTLPLRSRAVGTAIRTATTATPSSARRIFPIGAWSQGRGAGVQWGRKSQKTTNSVWCRQTPHPPPHPPTITSCHPQSKL